ncbi:MAG: PRC-barrel domain containing protein [Gaiellales bacterium]
MSTMKTEMWVYREAGWADQQTPVTGYSVEARDGSIGKIDEATYDTGTSYIVVDTGPWIFGKKVMLPAGVINRIDHDDNTVFVSLTKDEIKNSPEFDETSYRDPAYRGSLNTYYEPYYDREHTNSRGR